MGKSSFLVGKCERARLSPQVVDKKAQSVQNLDVGSDWERKGSSLFDLS